MNNFLSRSNLGNNYDLLKVIAIISMIIDHLGLYIFSDLLLYRVIGRIAAPIFFYLIGYNLSYRFRFNLIFYGSMLTLLNFLVSSEISLNILLNFSLIRILLNNTNFSNIDSITLIIYTIIIAIAGFLILPFNFIDYSTFGFIISLAGLLLRKGRMVGFLVLFIGLFFMIFPFYLSFYFSLLNTLLLVGAVILILALSYLIVYKSWIKYPRIINLLSVNSLSIYVFHFSILIYFNYSNFN